jgi:hypothetical protein
LGRSAADSELQAQKSALDAAIKSVFSYMAMGESAVKDTAPEPSTPESPFELKNRRCAAGLT